MATLSIEDLYERYVKPLPARDRLRLVTMTTEELSRESVDGDETGKRSLLDYEGIGKHNPVGMDAQEYVNGLRSEWDGRS